MQAPLTTNVEAAEAINVATVYYELREYAKAAECYRLATVADPSRGLAWFNLGNALDELRRCPEALAAYEQAAALHHADAHYNLALLLQKQGQKRPALKHWRAYLKLDSSSTWAEHARLQVRAILASDPLAIVARNGAVVCKMKQPAQPKTRAEKPAGSLLLFEVTQ